MGLNCPVLLRSRCRSPAWRASSLQSQRYLSNRGGLSTANSSIAAALALRPSEQGQQITVAGSVRTVRNQKFLSFVEVGDGSTVYPLRAVLEPLQAHGLATGTSVSISGVWQPAPPGKEQAYELKADEVKIIGSTDAEIYPIQKKWHTPEFLRTIPHLRLRTPLNALLARFRSECDFYLSTFFRRREFVRVQTPIITSSDCEEGSEVFTLHLEAFVHQHQKVWTLAPAFRAEKSETPRHLSEFWMLEAEIQTENLQDVMDLVEDMIRALVSDLQQSKIFDEIISIQRTHLVPPDVIRRRWSGLLTPSWPHITYSEVIRQLESAVESKQVSFEHQPSWSAGLQLEHERFIASEVGHEGPVFVTNYPQHLKPFYMLPSDTRDTNDGHATVDCFDLLLPDVCEVVGGSLREHRCKRLIDSMQKHGLPTSYAPENPRPDHNNSASPLVDAESLDWYLDLRRFGSVPHGGFGLGLDRLISYLIGVQNIKDVVPWPRWYGRCDC